MWNKLCMYAIEKIVLKPWYSWEIGVTSGVELLFEKRKILLETVACKNVK
jgi:hypothetical protein